MSKPRQGKVDLDTTQASLEHAGLGHAAARLPELIASAVKQELSVHHFLDAPKYPPSFSGEGLFAVGLGTFRGLSWSSSRSSPRGSCDEIRVVSVKFCKFGPSS